MPHVDKITRFGLLRHAPTMWNEEKRIQGQKDSPLTAEGKKHAEAWGRLLKMYRWARILSSDLGRARTTASIINTFLNIPLSCDSRLREREWGGWTGKTLKQVRQEDPLLWAEQEKNGWNFCPPKGEAFIEVLERCFHVLNQAANDWAGETILIVTHEGVIKSIIYRLCPPQLLSTKVQLIRNYHLHCEGSGSFFSSL